MKLHELHVGECGAGAGGHGNAVPGRFDRVRRAAEQPPDAAGGDDDRVGHVHERFAGRVIVCVDRAHRAVPNEQIVGAHVFHDVD